MKPMRKTTPLCLLCMALLLVLLPSFTRADSSGTCGRYLSWSFNSSTGKLTITGDGDMYDFAYSNESPIKPWYSTPWYSIRGQITSVSLPNGLTSIGWYAFVGCTGLTSVTIPNNVTSIGWHAFENCTGLTSVTIPNSVTSIGFEAFGCCTGLKSVTMSNSVTIIDANAFYGCEVWRVHGADVHHHPKQRHKYRKCCV